ncbi:MAG: response regulator [Bacteroidales bacterium]|nr:response regulator [Bacteroidales bacterium]
MTKLDTKDKTILIVDDDEDFLFQMKYKVESFGFKVITAETQKEAEEILKETQPDLAIFDLMMEKEDSGFILSYKAKKLYPDLPIIIATAVKSETGRGFGLTTEEEKNWIKADLYLDKGIRADQLEREIKNLLKL